MVILFIFVCFQFTRLSLAIPNIDNDRSKCSMYAVNFTEILAAANINNNGTTINVPLADPSWPIESCKYGWEYNHTEIPYSTIATEVFYFYYLKHVFNN